MTDITNPTPAVLADLSARMATLADGSTVFHDDQGQPIIDTSTAGSPYVDVKGAAAWHRKAHPEMWGETAAKPTTAPSQSLTDMTVTQAMQAGRAGQITDADAMAVASRHLTSRATVAAAPSKAGAGSINYTTAMRAAALGDANALSELMNRFR